LQAVEGGQSMDLLAQALVPRFIGGGALPEGVRLVVHALSQVYPATYRRALQLLALFDRDAVAFRRLAMPTLLLVGAMDPCTPPAALQALSQVLPDARFQNLAHVGHWPQLEDPDGFDAALLAFLAERRRLH